MDSGDWLIASQKPGKSGNIIPANIKEGTLIFSSAKGVVRADGRLKT